jgi:PAS domain-containing protein
VATPNRLTEILRVTADASFAVAAGGRGPDTVRTVLGSVGEALGATRVSFTVLGAIPSSIVWGGAPEGESVDVLVQGADEGRGILHLWTEPLDDEGYAAAEALAAVVLALSGPVAPDGSDVERWLRRHLDSIPVVTYTEYPDDATAFGYDEVYVSAQIERMLGYTPTEWVEDDDMARWLETPIPRTASVTRPRSSGLPAPAMTTRSSTGCATSTPVNGSGCGTCPGWCASRETPIRTGTA